MNVQDVTDQQLKDLGLDVENFKKSSPIMQKAVYAKTLAKKEAEEDTNNSSNFSDQKRIIPEWMSLEKYQKAFRIMGKPYDFRDKPTDPKLIFHSKVLESGGKYHIDVFWPWVEKNGKKVTDPDFILSKMYKEIQKHKWEEFDKPMYDEEKKAEVKGKRIYNYSGTPSFIWMMSDFGNSTQSDIDNKIPKKFRPASRAIMNVIDRTDDWCKDNKHTKFLTDYAKLYEREIEGKEFKKVYFNHGISASYDFSFYSGAYDKIFDHFQTVGKDLEDSDCIAKKNDGLEVYDATDNERYISSVKNVVSFAPLTEEEKNYEMYDADAYTTNPFIFTTFMKHLSARFKQFDVDCGTKFYEELSQLVKIEQEQNKKEDSTPVETKVDKIEEFKKSDAFDDSDIPFEEESLKKEEVKEETVQRRSSEPVEIEKDVNFSKNFPKWDSLSDYNKKKYEQAITHFENGVPIFDKKILSFIPCDKKDCNFSNGKRTAWPDYITECAVCGMSYEVK